MTRFQEVGVDRQHNSATPAEANRNFKKSCNMCAAHGFSCGACDRCPIASAHEFVVSTFELMSRIENERRVARIAVAR